MDIRESICASIEKNRKLKEKLVKDLTEVCIVEAMPYHRHDNTLIEMEGNICNMLYICTKCGAIINRRQYRELIKRKAS